MNTGINELAEKAKNDVPKGIPSDHWIAYYNDMFAKLIIEECVSVCGSQQDKKNIRKRFGLPVESDVKYKGDDPIGHYTQYGRPYNLPRDKN
jgi:hypothetical protein